MVTLTGSPTVILRGQKLAGGRLLYVAVVLSIGSALTALRTPAELGMGLVGFGIGTALLAYCMGLTLQEVRVYGEGFVWKRFWRESEVRWHQVRGFQLVHVHTWTGSRFELRIDLEAGTEHVLTHLEDAEDLRRYLNTFCRGASP